MHCANLDHVAELFDRSNLPARGRSDLRQRHLGRVPRSTIRLAAAALTAGGVGPMKMQSFARTCWTNLMAAVFNRRKFGVGV